MNRYQFKLCAGKEDAKLKFAHETTKTIERTHVQLHTHAGLDTIRSSHSPTITPGPYRKPLYTMTWRIPWTHHLHQYPPCAKKKKKSRNQKARKRIITEKGKKNALFLPKLINKRNLNRRLQIHLPKPIKPILRHHASPHLDPLLPIWAPHIKEATVTPYIPVRRHIIHDKMLEDGDANLERNGERDIIEDPKAGWHCGYLALGEDTWVLCTGFRELLFFETEETAYKKKVTEKLNRGTYTAASTKEFMSSWDVTSQWSAGTNGFRELDRTMSRRIG